MIDSWDKEKTFAGSHRGEEVPDPPKLARESGMTVGEWVRKVLRKNPAECQFMLSATTLLVLTSLAVGGSQTEANPTDNASALSRAGPVVSPPPK